MGFELVGKVWDIDSFRGYLKGVDLTWANSVTIHHTGSPSLNSRPKGWTIQHMRNLEHYYRNELGWSAGPHLFTDEDQIFGMSSLYRRGVHARSYNADSIGIECLGNYDELDDPSSGRGLMCWQNTAHVVKALLSEMALPVDENTIHFHRDDPKTSKTCPGKQVNKYWFMEMVKSGKQDDMLTLEQRIERIEKHLKIC